MSQSESLLTTSGHRAAIYAKAVGRRHILRALLSLASAALLLRCMGLLNQIVVTSRFGAGASMDAYFIASTLPTVFAQVIINTFQGSIIPTYARTYSQGKNEQASALFNTLLNLLLISTALLVLILFLFRRQFVLLSAPGLNSQSLDLSTSLTLFLYPALLLMSLAGFLEAILNAQGKFAWPAYAGLIQPLVTASLVLLFGLTSGVVMLCIGMVAGLSLQLGVLIVNARRAGLSYRPVLHLRNREVRLILSAAWPVLLGSAVSLASPLIDQVFASSLSTGSISALNYALKITSVFSGVVFSAVGRAVLPYLSRQATHDMQDFKETLRLYLWLVGIGTAVLSIFMILLAGPIVHLLFQRGAFTAADTEHAALTLVGYLIGLTPMAFSFILFTVFSALNKTKMLLRVAFFSVSLNALLDFAFARLWQSFGIALSTSVVYFCSVLLLFLVLRRLVGKLDLFTPPPEIVRALRKLSRGGSVYFGGGGQKSTTFDLFPRLRQSLLHAGVALSVFAVGVLGVIWNSLYALRISIGVTAMALLLRYPYLLVIAWAFLNALNAAPIFRGSNLLLGLTIPTLLLIPLMPARQTFKRMPALAFLLALLLEMLASIGSSTLSSQQYITYWAEFLDCLLVAILTINLLTTRRRLLGLIDALLAVSAFIALYGIYGYLTKHNGIEDSTTSLFRITSIFAAAPPLALFFSIIIPVSLYRMFVSRGFVRLVHLVLFVILLIATGLTFTRVVFISIPLSLVAMALFSASARVRAQLLGGILAIAVLAILLSVFGNLPLFDRFFNQDLGSLNGRSYLWSALLQHFSWTQLLGYGIYSSNYLLASLNVGINGQGLIGTSPHSLLLGTLYDNGIIGLALLVLVFAALFINIIAGLLKARGEHRLLFAATLAVFVTVAVQSLDSSDFWDQAISMYIWFALALPFAVCWSSAKQAVTPAIASQVEETVEAQRKLAYGQSFSGEELRRGTTC